MRAALGEPPGLGRTPELFAWKHFENPFGRSLMLVAEADGVIAGFRAFMRWQLEVPGGGTLRLCAGCRYRHPPRISAERYLSATDAGGHRTRHGRRRRSHLQHPEREVGSGLPDHGLASGGSDRCDGPSRTGSGGVRRSLMAGSGHVERGDRHRGRGPRHTRPRARRRAPHRSIEGVLQVAVWRPPDRRLCGGRQAGRSGGGTAQHEERSSRTRHLRTRRCGSVASSTYPDSPVHVPTTRWRGSRPARTNDGWRGEWAWPLCPVSRPSPWSPAPSGPCRWM